MAFFTDIHIDIIPEMGFIKMCGKIYVLFVLRFLRAKPSYFVLRFLTFRFDDYKWTAAAENTLPLKICHINYFDTP